MSSDFDDKSDIPPTRGRRPGRLTLLNLGWIAERVRKAERIKDQVSANSYRVDSEKLAKAILNEDEG